MSSSPRVTRLSSPVFEVGISPSPLGTADAALASDSDNPAAPNTGRALLRRFRFEVCFSWGIVNSFHTPADCPDRWNPFFGELRRHPLTVPKENLFDSCHHYVRNFLTKPVIHDRRMHAVHSLTVQHVLHRALNSAVTALDAHAETSPKAESANPSSKQTAPE